MVDFTDSFLPKVSAELWDRMTLNFNLNDFAKARGRLEENPGLWTLIRGEWSGDNDDLYHGRDITSRYGLRESIFFYGVLAEAALMTNGNFGEGYTGHGLPIVGEETISRLNTSQIIPISDKIIEQNGHLVQKIIEFGFPIGVTPTQNINEREQTMKAILMDSGMGAIYFCLDSQARENFGIYENESNSIN